MIFALLGAAGGGLMGLVALDAVKKRETEIEADKSRAGGRRLIVNEKRLARTKLALYTMIAGVPLGVIGGALALKRKGVIAGVLLLVTYALPFVILLADGELDMSDERARPIFFFPAGFVIAGLLAFFVRPARKNKNDEDESYFDDDEIEVEEDGDDRPRKPTRRPRDEDDERDDRPRRRR
ncbi:MAG: hypothetical protein FJ304_24350 [Planctomycetes bacterium]|nr:hypothetical protein [Planctomycetota bacterium]